jgi:hypothetical protein
MAEDDTMTGKEAAEARGLENSGSGNISPGTFLLLDTAWDLHSPSNFCYRSLVAGLTGQTEATTETELSREWKAADFH